MFRFFFKSLFKNYNEWLVWTTKLFSCICDITNFKSRQRKFEWLADGENAWLSSARFKIETRCGCFYITVFLKERLFYTDLYRYILHVISDKEAFVSGALFCVQRYRGNLVLYQSISWQIINLHIYAATNSASPWDYGINKFNCITVSVQFML